MMTRSKAKKAVLTPASSSQSIRIVHESEDEDPDFDDVTSAPPISPIYQAVDCHELDPFDTDNELAQELIDQFDLQPIFVSQLEHIGVTIHSTRRLCEIGIFSMESLLLMTENELIQQVSFSFLQNFRIREWRRKLENGREFPIPAGIIGALPVSEEKVTKVTTILMVLLYVLNQSFNQEMFPHINGQRFSQCVSNRQMIPPFGLLISAKTCMSSGHSIDRFF